MKELQRSLGVPSGVIRRGRDRLLFTIRSFPESEWMEQQGDGSSAIAIGEQSLRIRPGASPSAPGAQEPRVCSW